MKISTYLKYGFILIFLLGIFEQGTAQKIRKPKKPKKAKKSVLDNLPTFFVDDSRLPKYLKSIYKKDATRIAIRLLNRELRVSKQTVRVPEELVQALYNAMVAIRVSDYSVVDTVAKQYYVRTFPVPNVEKIVLVAEHDANWIEPLKHRQDTTGSPTINSIIRENNLAPTKLVHLDEERVALVLQSREPINVPALMMHFFMSEGVGSIEEVLPYGDGNDISIERTKTGWELRYSLRFSNCSNQCQKSHDWSFEVGEDGEVSYIGSAGHTIPPWIKKNHMGEKFPDILVSK